MISASPRIGRITPQGLVLAATASLALFGGNNAGSGTIADALGLKMNDVASKVSDLPTANRQADVWGLDFSADSSLVASGSAHQVDVWDWGNNLTVTTLSQPQGSESLGSTNPIQFSPDGRLLALCGSKGVGEVVLRLWSTKDWAVFRDISDFQPGGCSGFAFTPDGRHLIYVINRAGLPGDNIVTIDVTTGRVEWSLKAELFRPMALSISPDGRLAAIAGLLSMLPAPNGSDLSTQRVKHEPQVEIVDLNRRTIVNIFKSAAAGPVAWSRDGTRIAVGGWGYIDIFDVKSGKPVTSEISPDSTHINLRFSPDGRFLLDSDMNGKGTGLGVSIWDTNRKKQLQHISGNVSSIAFTRDGKYFAVGASGNTSIWRIK